LKLEQPKIPSLLKNDNQDITYRRSSPLVGNRYIYTREQQQPDVFIPPPQSTPRCAVN
jgi:hypothetical protein